MSDDGNNRPGVFSTLRAAARYPIERIAVREEPGKDEKRHVAEGIDHHVHDARRLRVKQGPVRRIIILREKFLDSPLLPI